MGGRWWRAYDEAMDDPKLLKLSSDLFRSWFILMCIASKNGGVLPDMDDLAIGLRMTMPRAKRIVDELEHCGLLDNTDGTLHPHNWNGRQFKSDVSTERVKRFRNGKRNVSSAVSETPPETETETETETERKETSIRAVAKATRPAGGEDEFEVLWKAIPKRGTAANPKKPAKDKFARLLKAGCDPREIIRGAQLWHTAETTAGRAGTEKTAQLVTWLNQERWKDYLAADSPQAPDKPVFTPPPGAPSDEELRAKLGK